VRDWVPIRSWRVLRNLSRGSSRHGQRLHALRKHPHNYPKRRATLGEETELSAVGSVVSEAEAVGIVPGVLLVTRDQRTAIPRLLW